MGHGLFGEVTSFQLQNGIYYAKGVENIFPQVCIALRIFVTIPVSVPGGERSLTNCPSAKLHMINNVTRKLSALVILSTEQELAKTLSYDYIINTFAVQKARKAFL